MAEVIPQINIDGTKIKDTWTEKEYVTDEVYNALNKTVIDLKNNNNLLDSNSILFREEYNSSSKNLNNAIHQGVYSFTNSAVNAPSGVNGGNLLVTNTSKTNQGSSIITQIAFCHNGAVYARTKNTSENFTSWNKLAYITDNVASATKATQDSEGKAINTTYLKRSGGTMSGALNLANGTLNLAGDDCYFGDQQVAGGFCLKGANGTTNLTFINKDDISKKASLSYAGGNLISSATIQGNLSGIATKATQDSAGQTINTTYVKSVSASNATLTITKGNGSTSTATVNNVSRAEYSDRVGVNAGYSNSTTGTSLKSGLSQSAIYNNSFPFSFGNLISIKNAGANQIALEWSGTTGAIGRVAVRSARDATLGTWSAWRYLAYTESPAFSGSPTAPTPATTDNSTRVATTAFVRNLLGRAVGKTQPTLTALIDWESMKSANGGTDVRDIKNTSSGITAYGGGVGALNKGDIILKQAFTKFDALLIKYTHDDGWWNKTIIIPTWEFNIMFNTKGYFQLLKEQGQYWEVRGNACADGRPSTTTRFNVRKQNCGIIEIYGITY